MLHINHSLGRENLSVEIALARKSFQTGAQRRVTKTAEILNVVNHYVNPYDPCHFDIYIYNQCFIRSIK